MNEQEETKDAGIIYEDAIVHEPSTVKFVYGNEDAYSNQIDQQEIYSRLPIPQFKREEFHNWLHNQDVFPVSDGVQVAIEHACEGGNA